MKELKPGEVMVCASCLSPDGTGHHDFCTYHGAHTWLAQAAKPEEKPPSESGTSQGSEQPSSSSVQEQHDRLLREVPKSIQADRLRSHAHEMGKTPAIPPPLEAALMANTQAILGLTEAIHRQADAIGQLVAQMSAPDEIDQTGLNTPSEYLSGGML